MDNGTEIVVKRGDVFWVRDRTTYDNYSGRPVLIISSDRGNETCPHVIGAYTTTKQKFGVINVPVDTPRGKSWIMCNHIISINKSDLGNYNYTLSEGDMDSVDRGLRIAMSLNTVAKEDDDEVERSLREEIASLENQLASKKDVDVEIVVERDMWKKMYEKAMEMLACAKMQEPTVEKEPVVVAEPVVEEPVVEQEPTVEINTCTSLDLRKVGCSPAIVRSIIENRPYKSVDDLRTVPNMTSVAFQILKHKLVCTPIIVPKKKKAEPVVTEKKLNINTATVDEMVNVVGINPTSAAFIRAYRNKHGKFEKLEDLLNVKRFGSGCLKKFGPMLEV